MNFVQINFRKPADGDKPAQVIRASKEWPFPSVPHMGDDIYDPVMFVTGQMAVVSSVLWDVQVKSCRIHADMPRLTPEQADLLAIQFAEKGYDVTRGPDVPKIPTH